MALLLQRTRMWAMSEPNEDRRSSAARCFCSIPASLKPAANTSFKLSSEVYPGQNASVDLPNSANAQSFEGDNSPDPQSNEDYETQEYVTRIAVTRQKYIPVCKSALVDAITDCFHSSESSANFITICSCLESILHAEHKHLLEQLRFDRFSSSSTGRKSEASNGNGSASGSAHSDRTARFQQNIMLVLKRAQFQELSARDLQLATALNSDYLLTLPIDVDWKSTSSAKVIIFRRGYATEKQEGFLFGAKLDYMQSLILKKIFIFFAKPLLKLQAQEWTEPLRKWLKEPLGSEDFSEEQYGKSPDDMPVWSAAQRAVPRYEAVLSSAGSRGKLLRRLLVGMRILPPLKTEVNSLFSDTQSAKEPYLRPSYLSRISMRDIWLPALECQRKGNVWEKLREAVMVFFSRSRLQEPAFKELVVMHERASNGAGEHLRLELNTYNNIPVPDLKVVFPNKKLSFRLLDTVRLDLTTIAGLLAFLVNYRFDDFLSSPSAFVLDIVATTSLIVFATRVALGYKQTWDRYQLLVNKTLYEKTLASGFGVVHFLIDASEEQQLKQVILMYGLLLYSSNNRDMRLDELASFCERYFYDKFKEQIEMPVKEAEETLSRLGLVTLKKKDSGTFIRAVPFSEAMYSLETKWQELLKLKNGYAC